MTDKFHEVKRANGAIDRVPNEDAERVGGQYVSDEAVRDLDVAMGDQADELTDHSAEDDGNVEEGTDGEG